MLATPYQTTATLISAFDLTLVTTAGSTTTTPYGFATAAQADAIVTQVNAIIAVLKAAAVVSIG